MKTSKGILRRTKIIEISEGDILTSGFATPSPNQLIIGKGDSSSKIILTPQLIEQINKVGQEILLGGTKQNKRRFFTNKEINKKNISK